MTASAPVKYKADFNQVREHLFNQFQNPKFDPDSGISVAELEAEVESFLNKNNQMPRVLQKAHVFRIVLTRGRISVDPLDWFADKLSHGGIVRQLQSTWLGKAMDGPLSEHVAILREAYDTGLLKGPPGGLDLGHIAPGWDNMLEGGLTRLLEQADLARSSLRAEGKLTDEKESFFKALHIVYAAAIELSHRFATQCDATALEHPRAAQRLHTVAEACRQVPANRPRTFHEALQFTWFMHELIELEGEFVRSMGQFDRSLYPFYKNDIESGAIDRNTAKELIKYYWIKWYSRTRGAKNGKNFVFAGLNRDQTPITNDLTYLALEAYEELNTPDPKLSVRFSGGESDELYSRVADLVRNGHNSFILLNDDIASQALISMGKSEEDARYYLPIGCYEPAVEGREAACTMNVTVNLAKIVELMMSDIGKSVDGYPSYESVWAAYTEKLQSTIETAARCIRAAESQWPMINPSPFIAGSFPDCVTSGKDIGQGGPKYNSVGFVGAGLANAADSLMAIKQAVYIDGRATLQDIVIALRDNYEGHDQLQCYLVEGIPKWGNAYSSVDSIGKDIANCFCNTVHAQQNGRGGRCQAALFTLDFAWRDGRKTGALPDGRTAGEPLAPGTGASYGRDTSGVTSLLKSVLTLDAKNLPNGSVLDVTLHPSAVNGPEGLAALVSLIKTYFARGGYGLQFNVYDVDTLRKAQRNPERYPSMQVRLTGWSVYFTSLSPFEQEQFISRISHK